MAAQPSMFRNTWSARLFNSKLHLESSSERIREETKWPVTNCFFFFNFLFTNIGITIAMRRHFLRRHSIYTHIEHLNILTSIQNLHTTPVFFFASCSPHMRRHIWKTNIWMRGFGFVFFFFSFLILPDLLFYMDQNQISAIEHLKTEEKCNFTISKWLYHLMSGFKLDFRLLRKLAHTKN